jgi:hypothetical protein
MNEHLGEALGRERKAARLAIAILRHGPPIVFAQPRTIADSAVVREVLAPLDVRDTAGRACGYVHISDQTWERVIELLTERG